MMPIAPTTIVARPAHFLAESGSFRIIAARIATISGITKPAFTSSTIGAPHPALIAITHVHQRRFTARPFLTR
jgi:hypothetical protein